MDPAGGRIWRGTKQKNNDINQKWILSEKRDWIGFSLGPQSFCAGCIDDLTITVTVADLRTFFIITIIRNGENPSPMMPDCTLGQPSQVTEAYLLAQHPSFPYPPRWSIRVMIEDPYWPFITDNQSLSINFRQRTPWRTGLAFSFGEACSS